MIMLENELSYLVKAMPTLDGMEKDEISQHYLTPRPNSVRLRQRGQIYEMAQKTKTVAGDASRKIENNILVDKRIYDELLPLSLRSLTKTRYYLPLAGGLTAELDVFHDDLDGLVMVEVEFPNEEARTSFVPPDWFGRDVSQEDWSSNSYLAGKTFIELEGLLNKT